MDLLPEFIKNYKHREFINNIITLMSGALIVQGISILTVPIITRLFLPVHFGLLALLMSIATIMSQLSLLCYDSAVILPDSEHEASGIAMLAGFVLIIFCVLLLLACFFIFGGAWQKISLRDKLGKWLYILPVVIFISGIEKILNNWNIRKKSFKVIAQSNVANSLTTPGVRIGLSLFAGSSVGALIIGAIIGSFVQIGILFVKGKELMNDITSRAKLPWMIQLSKKYRDFPLYMMPNVFLTSFSQNLPILMLGYMFAPSVVGFYAIANRLTAMPVRLASNSFRKVYLQKSSELLMEGKSLKNSFIKTTLGLSCLGILPFSILFFWGKDIFSLFLGTQWAAAGCYVTILVPWLFTRFILPPTNTIFIVMRKQSFWLVYQIVATVFKGSTFIAAYLLASTPEQTLVMFVAVSSACNIVIIIKAFKLSTQSIEKQ